MLVRQGHIEEEPFVSVEAAVSVAAYLAESINHFIKQKSS